MAEQLFRNRGFLGEYLKEYESGVRQNILRMNDSDLGQSNDLLIPSLVSKFKKNKIKLEDPQKEDMGDSPSSFRTDRISRKFKIKIKFSGNKDFFNYYPSSHSLNYPIGRVEWDNDIITTFEFFPGDSPQNLSAEIQKNNDNIKEFVNNINNDIMAFNNTLASKISQWLDLRREQLQSFNEAFDAIGFENTSEPE